MDFSILPPEIISGLIWSGPGAGALQNASVAWTNLAEQLEHWSIEARSVISGLGGVWKGPSSADMISSTEPYLAWLISTAEQARVTGVAASAAAIAYETAKAETIPPAVVTSNRSQFAYLITTNVFGQNAPSIAANETQYAAMWAQDAAAMNQYSASSLSATAQLPIFQPSPQVTNLSANSTMSAAQSATPAQTTLLQFIQQLIPGFTLGDPLGNLADVLLSPLGIAFISSGAYLDSGISLLVGLLGFSMITAATQESARAIANAGHALGGNASANVTVPPSEPVKAATAVGNRLGPMRVPPSWAQPQQPKLVTPLAPEHRDTRDRLGLPVIPAVPVLGAGKRQAAKRPGYSDPDDMHYGAPSKPILNRHPSGG